MREFNSELPTVLYTKGYDVVATTIEVRFLDAHTFQTQKLIKAIQIGDYILSPNIAIERKALDDLTQSLQSGRVFKQIEQVRELKDRTIETLVFRCWNIMTVQFYWLNQTESSKLKLWTEVRFKVNSVVIVEKSVPFSAPWFALIQKWDASGQPLQRIQQSSSLNWRFILLRLKPVPRIFVFQLSAPEPDVDRAISLKADQMEASSQETDDIETTAGTKSKKGKKWKPNPTVVRTLTQSFGMKVSEAHNLLANAPVC